MEITIQLDSEHAAQLAYIQQRSHLDPATVINHSIEQEYAKLQASKPTPLQIFEEAGLIVNQSSLTTSKKNTNDHDRYWGICCFI
jgi:hypothetical protein